MVGESPIDPNNGDQADVQFSAHLTDVRNASDLSDYTGELRAVLPLRITDRSGGAYGDASVTTNDVPLGIQHRLRRDPWCGGWCLQRRNVGRCGDERSGRGGTTGHLGLGQVQVFDGGADGDADTTGDNTLFAVQGAFTP